MTNSTHTPVIHATKLDAACADRSDAWGEIERLKSTNADLLEALEAIAERAAGYWDHSTANDDVMADARAAIRKARGEE